MRDEQFLSLPAHLHEVPMLTKKKKNVPHPTFMGANI